MHPSLVRTPWIVIPVLLVATWSHAADEPLSEVQQAIRTAAPLAASISQVDWQKLAYSETSPDPNNVENQSLAVMILTLRLPEKRTAAHDAEFRFLSKSPKPNDLGRAFESKRESRLITPLHANYIKAVTAEVAGETARGSITFEAERIYAGQVEFTARKTKQDWTIVEFRFPAWGTKTSLGDAGQWRLSNVTRSR